MLAEDSMDSQVVPVSHAVRSEGVVRWVFKRNCSLSPGQLSLWYFSLCSVSLLIAFGFWIAGYWVVLPFAGLELLVVGAAFLLYARHAADYEMIELSRTELRLVLAEGSRLTETRFVPQWARVRYDGRYKAPVVLSQRDKQVFLGKFINEQDKPLLHKELRVALAQAAH